MINLHWLYVVAGAVFAGFAAGSLRDETNPKRLGNAIFWLLLTTSFWFGDFFGNIGNGVLVLLIVGIAGFNLIGRGSKEMTTSAERELSSKRFGNWLFFPALIIPFMAFVGTLLINYTPLKGLNLIDPKAVTLVLLGAGVIVALIIGYIWFRPPALAAVEEGSRLANGIGWAMVLPQMLASLGVIFAAAGVGTTIGSMAGNIIPSGSIFLGVLLYALGMVVFTMIMGNAFAAFPVMAAAIGVPILIHTDGGNPAVIGAVGMLAGFCGTLMTPMAANFNIVPAALLELKNQHGVIKAQIPTAIPLLIANIVILYLAGFHL
ncbi:DUF979 domain-containing protein [Sphingomonas flavescens]|uniref:DUF979 domain-containing protein n=1 Tax=Sphingomonas flavescens TaxID=3132797 RepID=UPI002805100B|nr:DUF979 domain-containing protein [Sphingomonas limnosediminicola]